MWNFNGGVMKRSQLLLVLFMAMVMAFFGLRSSSYATGPVVRSDVFTNPNSIDQVVHPMSRMNILFPEDYSIEARESLVAEGRTLAQQILGEAAPRVSTRLLWNVLGSLNGSKITYPKPGYDFRACEGGMLAFVYFHGNSPEHNIYLCSLVLNRGVTVVAQTLAHESGHVNGFRNECDATRIEVTAMRFSGRDLAFRNGYMSSCGIN